jgi:hypothetical protein
MERHDTDFKALIVRFMGTLDALVEELERLFSPAPVRSHGLGRQSDRSSSGEG